jgi:hypothetical protein
MWSILITQPATEHDILASDISGGAMASDDANKSSSSNSPNDLARTCDKCAAEMTHLSDLQPGLGGAGLRVFRCYDCNHVVSEQM